MLFDFLDPQRIGRALTAFRNLGAAGQAALDRGEIPAGLGEEHIAVLRQLELEPDSTDLIFRGPYGARYFVWDSPEDDAVVCLPMSSPPDPDRPLLPPGWGWLPGRGQRCVRLGDVGSPIGIWEPKSRCWFTQRRSPKGLRVTRGAPPWAWGA